MNKLIIPLIIILAAITRLIPHPPNFTPIIAMGIFGSAYIQNRSLAVLIPISAMFLSDLFLGFHATIYWVYGSLLLVSILGMILVNKVNIGKCVAAALSGSFLFFIITNFGVWLSSGYYSNNLDGLLTCYTLALPFLGNTLIGTLFYTIVMFAGYELVQRNWVESFPESIQK
tara:strand:- start:154 stop:669 length:516 start_codon:yes stop_codon:yes gene_type:complete